MAARWILSNPRLTGAVILGRDMPLFWAIVHQVNVTSSRTDVEARRATYLRRKELFAAVRADV